MKIWNLWDPPKFQISDQVSKFHAERGLHYLLEHIIIFPEIYFFGGHYRYYHIIPQRNKPASVSNMQQHENMCA